MNAPTEPSEPIQPTTNSCVNQASTQNPWAIILAAGEGTRLASVTRFLYGQDVPKQFAALDGERTLLQGTMDRLLPLVPPHRTVVVVAKERRTIAEEQLAPYPGIQIVSQPRNAGTGPGVLLPLSLVKAQAPDATVIVTPSDHHVSVPEALEQALRKALLQAGRAPAGLALLGADADAPVADLGWIVPSEQPIDPSDAEVRLVQHFVEKPELAVAGQLFRHGGLWNTFVVVGSVAAFWKLSQAYLPQQTASLERYVEALANSGCRRTGRSERLLKRIYRSLAAADFSRTVLNNAPGLAVVRLKDSGWCDCGTPERLLSCLDTTVDRSHQVLKAIIHALPGEQPIAALPVVNR